MMRVGWMKVGSVSGDVKYLESWDACGHGLLRCEGEEGKFSVATPGTMFVAGA